MEESDKQKNRRDEKGEAFLKDVVLFKIHQLIILKHDSEVCGIVASKAAQPASQRNVLRWRDNRGCPVVAPQTAVPGNRAAEFGWQATVLIVL